MKKNIITIILVSLLIGAASFYGGIKYSSAKNQQRNFSKDGAGFQRGANGQGMRQGGGKMGGGFVSGEIIKKDDTSITVKLPDGGSKIIYVSDKTSVGKFVDGTKDDMEIGKNVMINGSANEDGSVAAQSVQIRTDVPVKTEIQPVQ